MGDKSRPTTARRWRRGAFSSEAGAAGGQHRRLLYVAMTGQQAVNRLRLAERRVAAPGCCWYDLIRCGPCRCACRSAGPVPRRRDDPALRRGPPRRGWGRNCVRSRPRGPSWLARRQGPGPRRRLLSSTLHAPAASAEAIRNEPSRGGSRMLLLEMLPNLSA